MSKASRGKEQQAQKVPPREIPAPFLIGWLAQPWIVLLLLSLLAILIYSNTFSASFQFDDTPNIGDNPRIRNFSSLLLSETRYVGFLSFALNYHFGELNVFGYHLVNLAIHITNGFLVYTLILILFKTPRIQSSSLNLDQSYWIALSTALLFVAHPVQTQAVTYITQRFASLAALFYLLAVVLYLKWRLAPSEAKSQSLWYAGALLSTVLAMKTKEITFTLPFMLLLVEAIFFGSFTKKRWITLIPFFLTLPIIPLSPLVEGFGERGDIIARETTAISRMDYLFTQFSVIMTYLRLLVFPVHQNLDYDYPIYHSLFEPIVFFSFLFLSALLGLAFYFLFFSQRSTRHNLLKLIGFGLLWFFLTLSIESSIIPIEDVILEHRLYLPSVGFFLAGSAAVLGLSDRWWKINAIAIGVVVAVLSVATYQRNLVWEDELALWSDVVQKSPNRARGRYNLGNAYEHLGRFDEAIQEYKTALALKPDDAETHLNLGNIYGAMGHVDQAIQEYKTVIALKPDFAATHYDLGIVYKNLDRLEEAIQEFQIALKLQPDFFQAHINLGNTYEALGHHDAAILEFKTVLALKPDFAVAHYDLGVVYKDFGRLEETIQEFQITLKLQPDFMQAHYSLGQVYQQMGRIQEAIHEFEQALQINPDYDPARQALKSLHQ